MRYFIIGLLALFITSCSSNKANLAGEEKAITALLEQERKAHFERNADLFAGEFSDSMISVNRGVVKRTPPDTMRKSIQKYFGAVSFIKWDDLAKPIIRFSNDGSMAYAIVQKEVIVSYPDTSGGIFYDTSVYAWTSIYRKEAGAWKVEANTSTNK